MGPLEILQWLHELGCDLATDNMIIGNACSRNDAKGGQLEVLQWLRSYGCGWDNATPSVRVVV